MRDLESQGIDVRHPDEFRVAIRLRGPSGAERSLELIRYNLTMMVAGVWPRELVRLAEEAGMPYAPWMLDAAKAALDGAEGFYAPPKPDPK